MYQKKVKKYEEIENEKYVYVLKDLMARKLEYKRQEDRQFKLYGLLDGIEVIQFDELF